MLIKFFLQVIDRMYEAIQNVLKESAYIAIISDIWTNKQMLDFMGLAVLTINFKKKHLLSE